MFLRGFTGIRSMLESTSVLKADFKCSMASKDDLPEIIMKNFAAISIYHFFYIPLFRGSHGNTVDG